MKNRKVLLFNVKTEKTKRIRMVCNCLNIQAVTVSPGQYGETLGALAGITGMKKTKIRYSPALFSKEMMVFSGIDSGSLDEFLERYRAALIPVIPLKAVLTPYNIQWDAQQLYRELEKEHKEMS